MNREEWVQFFKCNPSPKDIIFTYCEYKGKSRELTEALYTLARYGLIRGVSAEALAQEAYDDIAVEFKIMELSDKEGNIIKIY